MTFVSPQIATEASQAQSSKSVHKEKKSEDGKNKCMWSAQELKVLRNSVKCSKLNNIRLSVLTKALQKDCERVRNTCQEQSSEIVKLTRKYNDIKKQNKAMKITCKAFKQDAKNAQENLEVCRARLENATRETKVAELELVRMKNELEAVQKRNKLIQIEFEKQQVLQEKRLENQNVSLRSLYEKEVTDLLQRLERTELCLEKERNEHTITKKALSHLRLHFAGDDH